MRRFLTRLAQTSPAEIRFRCRDKARITAEALRFVTGRERWRRADLKLALDPVSPEIARVREAIARGDLRQAGIDLRAHFVGRSPRFVIDPSRREAFARALRKRFPGCVEDAVTRAERLLADRYDVLGYRDLSFTSNGSFDWHLDPVSGRRSRLTFWTRVPYLDPRFGDHKVIWEVNRHQHWLALGRAAWLSGDRGYANAIVDQLRDWLDQNPPLRGTNWSSMLELALRSLSWIWSIHLLAAVLDDGDTEWLVDLLLGLDRQLNHVARHLSVYFSPNTHLLGEALALYVGGRVMPELHSSARWESVGRRILIDEAHAQVHPDGAHAELSSHYHRYALDFYLLALAIARKTDDAAASHFEEVCTRLASYCRAIADDRGQLPTIGDDDGGMLFPMCGRAPADASDSLALAAVLLQRPELAIGDPPEEVFWMLGGSPSVRRPHGAVSSIGSRVFPDSGYVVLRARGVRAILDAGPHGFRNAGHAHADSLSLVLSVDGHPILVDPGTYTYTADPNLRDRFRSTRMHNTVVVDGRNQSVADGPFHWRSTANGRITCCRTHAEVDYVEAEHDGYAPLVHRRGVVRDGRLWIVIDYLLGEGDHRTDAYWHFAPGWTIDETAIGSARLASSDGYHASIASTAVTSRDMCGDAEGLGWCAPVYGQHVASPTICFSNAGAGAARLMTAVATASAPIQLSLVPMPVTAGVDDRWLRAAALVSVDHTRVLVGIATPEAPKGPEPGARAADAVRSRHLIQLPDGSELSTDARVAILHLSQRGEPSSLHLVDGASAEWTGPGAFRIAAEGGPPSAPVSEARDLHLDAATLERLRSNQHAQLVG